MRRKKKQKYYVTILVTDDDVDVTVSLTLAAGKVECYDAILKMTGNMADAQRYMDAVDDNFNYPPYAIDHLPTVDFNRNEILKIMERIIFES